MFQRVIFSPKGKNSQSRPGVHPFGHAGQELGDAIPGKLFDLFRQGAFQTHTPGIQFIIAPGEFPWAVASKGAGSLDFSHRDSPSAQVNYKT